MEKFSFCKKLKQQQKKRNTTFRINKYQININYILNIYNLKLLNKREIKVFNLKQLNVYNLLERERKNIYIIFHILNN